MIPVTLALYLHESYPDHAAAVPGRGGLGSRRTNRQRGGARGEAGP